MMTQNEKKATIKVINAVLELQRVESELSENLIFDIILMLEDNPDWYKIKKISDEITETEKLENYLDQLKRVVVIE